MLATITRLAAPLRKSIRSHQPPTVLVVDDDPTCLRVTVQRLRHLGYRAVSAGDGEEALEVYSQGGADVVLTDIHMPGMNGVNLIINLMLESPDLPVIGMTGLSRTARETLAASTFGARRVLMKPLRPEQLSEALAEVAA